MSLFKKTLKWVLLTTIGLTLLLFAFGYWFIGLIPKQDAQKNASRTVIESLPYLSENKVEYRGKILAIVTSTKTMGTSGKATGYELTELSRAYYVFQANGFEVDVASPEGGEPAVVIDDDDMGVYDFAFLNDPVAQLKSKNTLALSEVDTSQYSAIYFVGGKGAMYDFPDNPHIQAIVKSYFQSGKVIGAVCHGPAALVNVMLDGGRPLLIDKSVCSFTNNEELLLIPDAETIFPFLLQSKLVETGANFKEGAMYLENVVKDQNLITGQNPWSTWRLAEAMIEQMGYQPKARVITPEENAVEILGVFEQAGYASAKKRINEMAEDRMEMDRTLLAMHSIVSAMQWDFTKCIQLIGLVSYAKDVYEEGAPSK